MLRVVGSVLLFVSLFSIVSPPRFLGAKGRRKAIVAALIGCLLLIVSDDRPPSPSATVEAVTTKAPPKDQPPLTVEAVAAKAPPEDERTRSSAPAPAVSAPVQAILGKQSLFVEVRNNGNVYCAADGPFWVIGEIEGEFVALNGLARQWAANQHLSVYREGKWIPVNDRGTNPSNLGLAKVQDLIDTGNGMCPSSSKDILEEASQRVKEGEKKFAQLGPKFGLPAPERAAAPAVRGKATMTADTFGCSEQNLFDRILELTGSGDRAAALRLMTASLVKGACIKLSAGQTVFIEQRSGWSGTRCVRPEGETDCVWTIRSAMEP